MLIKTKRYTILLLSAAALLLLPLLAMQFTTEVNWKMIDFFIMALLLFVLVSSIEYVLQHQKLMATRLLWIGLALLVFLLVWAELAVGVFGTPFAGS